MTLNLLLAVFSVIAMADGLIAVLAPGPFMSFIWAGRGQAETHLFVQGWGACLIVVSVVAWVGRRLSDRASRQVLVLSLLTYHLVVSVVWLLDALDRGWTPLSVITLVALAAFAFGFVYFGLGPPSLDLSGEHNRSAATESTVAP